MSKQWLKDALGVTTDADLARALKITPQAIHDWGETVPEKREYQLRVHKPELFLHDDAPRLAASN